MVKYGGGVPAKYIMKTEEYVKKVVETSKSYPWKNKNRNLTETDLITLRQEFFFK